jgi:hypothetical protein
VGKTATDINVRDTYRFYKNTYISKNIDFVTYGAILKDFNTELVDMINRGMILDLPYQMGTLYVSEFKPRYEFTEDNKIKLTKTKKNIDFKATKEYWKEHPEAKENKIYLAYENFHTDGACFKIVWKKTKKNVHTKVYNFCPARQFSRRLAAQLKTNKVYNYANN